jgi:hypothetical protein
MSLRIRSNAGMPPRRATGERTMFRSSRGPVSWLRCLLADPRPLRRAQLSRLPSPLRAGDRRLRARRQTSYSLRRPNKRRAAASSTFGVALPRRRVCVLASLAARPPSTSHLVYLRILNDKGRLLVSPAARLRRPSEGLAEQKTLGEHGLALTNPLFAAPRACQRPTPASPRQTDD